MEGKKSKKTFYSNKTNNRVMKKMYDLVIQRYCDTATQRDIADKDRDVRVE